MGLVAGLALFLWMLLAPPPEGMPLPAWRTAAVGTLMAVWWVTEAIPIPATALVPLALFPVLGVLDIDRSAAPYANPIIGLFLGGFLIAQAMTQWMLHRRIALGILTMMGARPDRLVAGFMIASAFISAWISNTATAVMMLPIGLSVVRMVADAAPEQGTGESTAASDLPVALMLGIAYACSIGGLATLIGSPPNALFAGMMAEQHGVEIGFGRYMLLGVPLVLLGLPLTWLVLTRWSFRVSRDEIPGAAARIDRAWESLGPMSRGERVVGVVFVLTALAWIFRPLLETAVPGLSDTGIAIGAALVLFGGGLSLANAVSRTQLADWIGSNFTALQGMPSAVAVLVVTFVIIFLTELTSNTATAAAFIPIVASLAVVVGAPPVLLAAPAALAASCAFMLPVATPPNAVVFSGGYVTIPQMVRAGFVLNLIFALIIAGPGSWLVIRIFG